MQQLRKLPKLIRCETCGKMHRVVTPDFLPRFRCKGEWVYIVPTKKNKDLP